MINKTPRKAISHRTVKYAVTGLFFGCGLITAIMYGATSGLPDSRTKLVSFSNLPEGASGDIRVESASGNRFFKVDTATPFIEHDADALVPPYRLYATVKLPGDLYRDFTMTIDKNRQLSTIVDGFDPWDPITMTVGEMSVFEIMPADWSGKLQLDAPLPQNGMVQACVEINSAAGTLGICHDAPEGRRS